MATFIVLVCIYYGYHVSGGPVGVGKATAQSMVANILGIHVIGMVGTPAVLGRQRARADRRLSPAVRRSRWRAERCARLAALLRSGSRSSRSSSCCSTAGSTYVLHAQFSDAGQLVSGDLVTVAGHQVGSVGAITLRTTVSPTSSSTSAIEHHPDPRRARSPRSDSSASPGVANRFVGLALSRAGRSIASGGTLPSTQTRGIVDLDVFLDALTPQVRASIAADLRTGAYFVHQPTASQLNRLSRTSIPPSARPRSSAPRSWPTGSRSTGSSPRPRSSPARSRPTAGDLGGAVTSTAATLREVASQRAALGDAICVRPPSSSRARGCWRMSTTRSASWIRSSRTYSRCAPRLATLLTKGPAGSPGRDPDHRRRPGARPQCEIGAAGIPAGGDRAADEKAMQYH